LPDLVPLTGPLAAVEAVLRAPTIHVAHAGAKIIHMMNGRARIGTARGELSLSPGDVPIIAAGSSSATKPDPWLRSWAVYIDETFFRQHMRWAIPANVPLVQGVSPSSWHGSPRLLRLDPIRLARVKPILRRTSLITAADSYAAVASVLALFARAVEVVTPAFVANGSPPRDPRRHDRVQRASTPPVRAAIAMIEERLAYPWRMGELATAVALSRSHLTRLSHRHLWATPLQMQAELRVTEFTRLTAEMCEWFRTATETVLSGSVR
jgi:hypothetical protein